MGSSAKGAPHKEEDNSKTTLKQSDNKRRNKWANNWARYNKEYNKPIGLMGYSIFINLKTKFYINPAGSFAQG
ncbi:MAG: hypothetical protein Q8835_03000, partial [Sweet potato little leaf phytoplasma]|nr:hypothetical protein [Sweet potato little leaf phytoplasma]